MSQGFSSDLVRVAVSWGYDVSVYMVGAKSEYGGPPKSYKHWPM